MVSKRELIILHKNRSLKYIEQGQPLRAVNSLLKACEKHNLYPEGEKGVNTKDLLQLAGQIYDEVVNKEFIEVFCAMLL